MLQIFSPTNWQKKHMQRQRRKTPQGGVGPPSPPCAKPMLTEHPAHSCPRVEKQPGGALSCRHLCPRLKKQIQNVQQTLSSATARSMGHLFARHHTSASSQRPLGTAEGTCIMGRHCEWWSICTLFLLFCKIAHIFPGNYFVILEPLEFFLKNIYVIKFKWTLMQKQPWKIIYLSEEGKNGVNAHVNSSESHPTGQKAHMWQFLSNSLICTYQEHTCNSCVNP